MIKTPLSTMIGGAFWTPCTTIIGSTSATFNTIIKSLFANNEQGFAYDPNDLTTLYQDAAGTIPVTAQGQPVGLMRDKSGHNNHAFQTVSASRPILQRNATTGAYYLAFDGADDFLRTSNIDFTSTDKVSVFAGVRKLSDAATGALVGLSYNPTEVTGSFEILAPSLSGTNKFQFSPKGTDYSYATVTNSAFNAPVSVVISAQSHIANDVANLRLNGSLVASSKADQGTGNYGNYPLYIGRRGGTSLSFNGHLYSLIGIGRLTSASETIALEKAIAKQTGVTLNV